MFEAAGAQFLVPDFGVQLNGTDLPSAAATDLLSVEVHDSLDAPSMCSLQLVNWDMTALRMTWSDDPHFAPGGTIDVRIGYVDHLDRLFSGEITGLEPEFNANDVPLLVVRCYDLRHRLMRGRKTRAFANMKDSEIALQIGHEAGLKMSASDTDVKFDHVLQHNQTDMEFLLERARRIGYELRVDDGTLMFEPHQHDRQETVVVSFEAGDLLEFWPRLTTLGQVDSIEMRAWDMRKKTAIVSRTTASALSTTMGQTTGPTATQEAFGSTTTTGAGTPLASTSEADRVGMGWLGDMALGYITGEATCVGNTAVRAGTVIRLDGLGKRFSGLYYVTATVHTVSPRNGYRTMLQVRRNAAT